MRPLSDKALKVVGGYENVSADFCDIRQSILRALGYYDEAVECIKEGLKKQDIKPHTRGLLYVGLADIFSEGDVSDLEFYLQRALDAAQESKDYDQRQAARIYAKCADICIRLLGNELAKELRDEAMGLASGVGAKDRIFENV